MSDNKPTPAEVMEFVDGALGAAGHRVSAETNPYGRFLIEQVAAGEITADEAVALGANARPYYIAGLDQGYVDAYLNRLVQFMGPTPMAAEHPDSMAYRIAEKRHGRRDEEISAINPGVDDAGRQGDVREAAAPLGAHGAGGAGLSELAALEGGADAHHRLDAAMPDRAELGHEPADAARRRRVARRRRGEPAAL